MANKTTKKDYLKKLLTIEEVATNEELKNFVVHEIELLENRSAKKGASSKVLAERKALKIEIFTALQEVGRPVTVTELQKENENMNNYSNQRISSMLKKLIDDDHAVNKIPDKKRTLFATVEDFDVNDIQ